MLVLHGSAISNYYNKVKLALLEKGVPFEEAYAATHSSDEAMLSASPLGKIPFVTTPEGGLCESQPLLEWIEARWPTPPLLPADPFAAAKVRELTTFIDWHLEIVARQLYGSAFFGAAPLSEANSARIKRQLVDNIAAFKRLAKFAPFVAGAGSLLGTAGVTLPAGCNCTEYKPECFSLDRSPLMTASITLPGS